MKQNMVFLVEDNGRKIQDDDILVYNENSKCFYVTSARTFLAAQNNKIQKFLDDITSEKTAIIKEKDELKDEFNKLKESYTDFIQKTKTINDKLINMVEKFIKQGENQ